MTTSTIFRVCAVGAAFALGACDAAGTFSFLPGTSEPEVTRSARTTKLVERDVEAPEIFQVTEEGLWDGRPSLGGVWVAHPDVAEPERVIIRNEANDKFVIGALFRKERETPGPVIQISSDAAGALGALAGSPVRLSVTALRREEIAEEPEAETADILPAAAEVASAPLEGDPIAAAARAIEATAPAPQPIPDAVPAAREPTPAAARATSSLAKPFIQIGIFSIEANARGTADKMRASGIIPTVYEQSSRGKDFWRVVVGPITTESDRAEVLKTVKSLGFSDAFFVTN